MLKLASNAFLEVSFHLQMVRPAGGGDHGSTHTRLALPNENVAHLHKLKAINTLMLVDVYMV